MRDAEDYEILESVFIEMDPAVSGFVGVFVDLWRRGEEFVFTETAAGTGNRLLTFSSRERESRGDFHRARRSTLISCRDQPPTSQRFSSSHLSMSARLTRMARPMR